jgi:hypothetical protein
MALFVPLEHGIQVELVFHLDGRILTNRLWFVVVAGDPTSADLVAVASGVASWAIMRLMPYLSQDIKLLIVRATDATVPYPGPQEIALAGVFGGVAEGSYSANVAVKVEFQTFTPPALWLNWNFLGGIPLSAVTLNTIDSTFKNNIKNAFVFLLDVFSLFVYRWEATSAVENGVPHSTRPHYRIDHILIRRQYVSQRRTRLDNPT